LAHFIHFFRNHAHQDTKRREFWEFEDVFSSQMRNAILQRYRLLPYIYTLFYFAHVDLTPVMRPLWYEFWNEAETFEREDAFMFGDVFYVQPIVSPGVSTASVSLPGSQTKTLWYDVRPTKPVTIFNGGKTYEIDGYDNCIPFLRKGGSITVEKHRVRRSSLLMKNDPLTLIIALDVNGNAFGYYYHDDEESMLFEQQQAYLLSQLTMNKCSLENKVLHTNNVQNLFYASIERIIIFGNISGIDYVVINQNGAKTTTKEFGVAKNTFVIRKPSVTLNNKFTIQFVRNDGDCTI